MNQQMSSSPKIDDEELVGVYYSSPWLPDWPRLAAMVLTFDRIQSPHTFLPFEQYDPSYTFEEFIRIKDRLRSGEATLSNEDDQIRVNMLRAATYAPLFKGIWEYNCESPSALYKAGGLSDVADQLELATRGPREPGWLPRFTVGLNFHVGDDGVPLGNVPGRYYYAAGSLLYATKHGLPLIHDDPDWIATLPGDPSVTPLKTEDLAHQLMLRSIEACVPRLHDIGPKEILDLRSGTRDLVRPFRTEMRKLAYQLRLRLAGADQIVDIQNEVNEHIAYVVTPLVQDLRRQLSEPSKPWYRWIRDPLETAATFAIVSSPLTNPVVTACLFGAWRLTMDGADAEKKRDGFRANPMYYLVRAEDGKK